MGVTVGVLSPFVGGDFYGAIIEGALLAAPGDARMVAIQTLDPGSDNADVSGVPELALPVGWDHIDGFLILASAAPAGYLRAIQAAGKPLVLISHTMDGVTAPAVLADNRFGIGEAVDHLVAHGHRRIAFIGFLGAADLRQRAEAWEEAMDRHGLYDPNLLFHAHDNHATGGARAATAMLAAGLPGTATICGTDHNAFGVMETLRSAGVTVPAEQAVVGFDDVTAAQYASPSLSSVRQPLGLLGRTAMELLVSSLDGRGRPDEVRLVPTRLVPRESCGCQASGLPTGAGRQPDHRVSPAEQLYRDLGRVVPAGTTLTASQEDRLRTITDELAAGLTAAADGRAVPESRLPALLSDLYQLGAQPQTLDEVALALRFYADTLPGRDDADRVLPVERHLQQIVLHLSHLHSKAQFHDVTYLQDMLNGQYLLGMGLLRSHERDPRSLAGLDSTPLRAGVLSLWDHDQPADGDPRLDLAGAFRRDGPMPAIPPTVTAGAFPPAAFLDLATLASGEVVFVVPVRSVARDWGLLAAIGHVQARTPPGREVMNQSGALLAVALDLESMLTSLHEQEEQLRRAALYDQLTGLANRNLLLDRLASAQHRRQRAAGPEFALLFLDLDGFKTINDTLGHAVGDQVLIGVADRIRQVVRGTDTAARFGGDEFVILLEGFTDASTPEIVKSRLRASLSQALTVGERTIEVSASIGMALSSEAGALDAAELLHLADAEMYRFKASRSAPSR